MPGPARSSPTTTRRWGGRKTRFARRAWPWPCAPNDAVVLYNVACTFGQLGRKAESLGALRKAWDAGFKDPSWARRDPDLAVLRGDPEFEKLYPPTEGT